MSIIWIYSVNSSFNDFGVFVISVSGLFDFICLIIEEIVNKIIVTIKIKSAKKNHGKRKIQAKESSPFLGMV